MNPDPDSRAQATPPAADLWQAPEGRILDPVDRNSEILFGLLMVLTFTGTLSVASAGREDVRSMMVAAIGCNIAWGLVDGVMYVLRSLVMRSRQAALGRAVRAASLPENAHRLIAKEFGPLSESLGSSGLERVRQWVIARPAPVRSAAHPTAQDFKGGLGVFLLVFASTFPVVMPFIFIADLRLAMRVSGAVAIVMMLRCGYVVGRYAGLPPWRAGFIMVLVGAVIESIIIALGG